MAENKRYYWLKLKENFFDDDNETISWLEEQENGKEYCLFYLKLCLKSLKSDGVLIRRVGEILIPYDAKKLSEMTRTNYDTVITAMKLFQKIGLVSIMENGEIYLTQLSDMVGSETDKAAMMRRKREKDAIGNNVTKALPKCYTEIEKEIEIDKELEKEIDISVSKDTDRRTDIQRAVEKWNSLASVGIKSVSKLSSSSKRYQSLMARINEYGIDAVLKAIDKAGNSDFLKGRNKKGWAITFDWFVLPNNFPKVLEGNYDNAGSAEENAPKPKEAESSSGSPIERLPAEFADKLRKQGMVDDDGSIFYTMLSKEDLAEVRKWGLLQ